MVDQRNTIRVFVAARSGPIRRRLLRMCDELPLIQLVGIATDHLPAPRKLTELHPDLLLLDVEPRTHQATYLFSEIAQHLPHCKTIVLSKHGAGETKQSAPLHPNGQPSALIDPDDQTGIRDAIRRSLLEKRGPCKCGEAGTHDRCPPSAAKEENILSERTSPKASERRSAPKGRRLLERTYAESASRFRAFVEQLPGIPYMANLDIGAGYMYVGPRIEEVLGYSPREWCADAGLPVRCVYPEDRARVIGEIASAIERSGRYSLEYRVLHRDGSVRWIHDEAHVATDAAGTGQFVQGAMLDITERKNAQEELERSHCELQELISTLDTMRSGEQKRLAQEMHDDFGQLLAAMKIDLCALQRFMPQENADALKYLAGIQELVDTMMTSVRRILADLPPSLLEDMTLAEAVESIAASFRKRHGICCRLNVSGNAQEYDKKIVGAAFRIVQEAFNNVAKHSRATEVKISLSCTPSCLSLRVADNGKGMQPGDTRKPGSFGLVGMRERVSALRGTMKLESRPGKGTSISIAVPISAGRKTILSSG